MSAEVLTAMIYDTVYAINSKTYSTDAFNRSYSTFQEYHHRILGGNVGGTRGIGLAGDDNYLDDRFLIE